jgi:hypothetical protein
VASTNVEKQVIDLVTQTKQFYGRLNVELPWVVMLSLIAVEGYELGVRDDVYEEGAPADRPSIILHEVILEDPSVPSYLLLRPVLDMMWQAFGFTRSLNYNDDGSRRP